MKTAVATLQTKINQLIVELRVWKNNPSLVSEIKKEIADHQTALEIIKKHSKN